LLLAQYYFEGAINPPTLDAVRRPVTKHLNDARSVAAGGNNAGQLVLWTARIYGQEALVSGKEYEWSPAEGPERQEKGLLALDKLGQAIRALKALEQSHGPQAASDAVYLRYVLGDVTRKFLKDARVTPKPPAARCKELKDSAVRELNSIGPDTGMWKKRQRFLSHSMLPTVDWCWGYDEDQRMFNDDRSPTQANIPTTLARDILRIEG
jgi:hypothetical protein